MKLNSNRSLYLLEMFFLIARTIKYHEHDVQLSCVAQLKLLNYI